MHITSITETGITFDTGTSIHIEPPDILMQIEPEEQEKAFAGEFRYIGFIERRNGFAFGEILGEKVEVRLTGTAGHHFVRLKCGNETKINIDLREGSNNTLAVSEQR